jgi:hypothetical protein
MNNAVVLPVRLCNGSTCFVNLPTVVAKLFASAEVCALRCIALDVLSSRFLCCAYRALLRFACHGTSTLRLCPGTEASRTILRTFDGIVCRCSCACVCYRHALEVPNALAQSLGLVRMCALRHPSFHARLCRPRRWRVTLRFAPVSTESTAFPRLLQCMWNHLRQRTGRLSSCKLSI